MGGGQSSARPEETEGIVGAPVRVTGISKGEFGEQEVVAPGKASVYYEGTGLLNGNQCAGWICTCLQWPCSSLVFLVILAGQLCAPCFYCCCGVAWCMKTSQITYIHSLYVIWQTLKNTWYGNILCCGCFVNLQPAVLFVTTLLATPPKFLFDEDKDTPYLMTFQDYAEAKKKTWPAFSGRYRAVDGGGNQQPYTFIGQGARGYAMNEPYMILDSSAMPDPVEMQRALQLRTTFTESPFGQNAIATWFANVAIHDFFRSATGADKIYTGGVEKPWVNLHSGYLDLQVLYGWNQELADSVRTFVDGKLKGVAETRFDGARLPETKAIVTMMMREHNYVCEQLKVRYPYQFTTDEALYQQARLIMGAVFINVILRQYGDQMFGEDAPDGRGFAELRQRSYGIWPGFDCCCGFCCGGFHNQTAGNQPTFNFNLIYRWHTGIPQEWSATNIPPDQTDDELRQIFTDAYNWKAGGFGPNNMPADLFVREISVPAAAVLQGRKCGAPRLNDFRRRFTTPYKSFEDMCGDPDVAAAVAKWYPTVEDVELAVGCQVERTMFGGWNLGQTVGLAILADAFNSIRQDRFYTTDFTPEHYTEWGYQHAKTTILTDILNRNLSMNLPRDVMLARIPDWQGPPAWSELKGFPFSQGSFSARGWPVLK
mmetsp:Transcript_74298/g.187203  ORF Transcript_74298/g.187203 Transcript_74298/m.187203 type:complete len:654 (-) Transcript_74298:34-1995(-)